MEAPAIRGGRVSGRKSRTKGQRGEREVVRMFKENGCEAERGWQSRGGGPDQPDVVVNGYPLHIEVKRAERLNVYQAMEQAIGDAQLGFRCPVVFHKRNNKPWLVFMLADDWFEIVCDEIKKEEK